MLASDQTIWQESISSSSVEHPFVDKDVLYIQDQNNGNYAGQIQFDCSSLANNSRWLNYKEGLLEIPFMINFKSSISAVASEDYVSAFVAGLKNGYYQIIDSMQVDLNNQNIVQLQNNLNVLVNYKVMTSFSQDDLNKLGPALGICPDSSDSYLFSAGASSYGDGYSNNRNIAKTNSFTARNTTNEGFFKRQCQLTANAVSAALQTDYLPVTGVDANAAGVYDAEARNYFRSDGGTTTARVWTWVVMATIRLKDLCSFFEHVPLMKGANFRFTINYNSTLTTITTVKSGVTMVTTTATQLSGHTNPVILASSAANNACNLLVDNVAGTVVTIACGVVKTSLTSTITSAFSSCRLYVPAYKLDADYELSLIKTNPVTNIKYLDYYTYTVDNVSAGSSFNQILTNGIVNPKAIVIVPFAAPGSSAAVNALNLPQYQMIFDSAPGTTCPSASITNFQILLAGENVFNLNEFYTFSQFMDEFQHINALNGSQDTGLNAGLISEYMWRNGYRYYVADLSRRLRLEDKIPKSVQIQGTNNTKVAISYMCFVLYERSVNVKTSTGEILP